MLSAVMATACGAVTTGTHTSSPSAALPTHGSPLAVSSQTFHQGEVSLTYPNVTMSATGGAPPYTWSLSDGALPGGLMLAPDGTIFGVPTALPPGTKLNGLDLTGAFNTSIGAYRLTVAVTDSLGAKATINAIYNLYRLQPR